MGTYSANEPMIPITPSPIRGGDLDVPVISSRDRCVPLPRNSLTEHLDDHGNPHKVTAEQVGAYSKSSVYTRSEVDAKVASVDVSGELSKIGETLKAKADLVNGVVPIAQLPSYGSDVLEYSTFSKLPATGETSKIYITLDTNLIYRWGGTNYIEVSAGTPVTLDTDGNKITVGGKSIEVAPKSHVSDTNNPHNVTAEQVDAYTKSEVDTKLSGKLDSSAISEWAKGESKPTYTASEVGVTLDEKTNKITIGKNSVTPLTKEIDPVFTEWKGGTSVALGSSASASEMSSTALGANATASGENSTALGYNSYTATANTLGLSYTPDQILLGSTKTDKGATAKSLRTYLNEKADVSAIPTLDDVRDKLDLSVYSKYTEWYIIDNDYPPNVLAKMEGDGVTFTGEAEVYSGQEHLNKITVYVSYDTTTGKVSKVSGETQTWYPLSNGDQPPAYTRSEFIPDDDAVSMINDLDNGCFTAISYYFDENGQRQSGWVRFKVEYTGAPQELDDTLVKTSDIPEVPTKVSAFTNDAGYLTKHQSLSGYLKTSELASKEIDPVFTTWKGTTVNSLITGGGNATKDLESNHVIYGMNNQVEDDAGSTGGIVVGKNNITGFGDSVPGIIVGSNVSVCGYSIGIGRYISDVKRKSICIGVGTSAATLKSHGDGTFNIPMESPEYFYFNATSDSEARTLQSYLNEKADATTVSALAAKVDTANATLEEVV